MSTGKKVGVYGKLNEFKLGSQGKYVIYFMKSIMVVDNKSMWDTKANARRCLSIAISKEWNSNEIIKKKYPSIGDFRSHLEKMKIVSICKDTDISLNAVGPS